MDFSKSAKLNNLATIDRPEANTKIIWINFGGGNDYAEITLPTVAYGNYNGAEIKYRDNIVYIDLTGACKDCSMIDVTLKDGIEEIITNEIPEVKEVRIID